VKLYTYYRSQASFRVRIALNLKGWRMTILSASRARRPVRAGIPGAQPADGGADPDRRRRETVQSLAILEYLDEKYPEPPLLRGTARRAPGCGGCADHIADSHPLIVRASAITCGRTATRPGQDAPLDPVLARRGLAAMETLLAEHKESGDFCHGERPTVADIALVTQVTPAKTFDCDLAPYPRVMRIYDSCMALPAFAEASHRSSPMRSSFRGAAQIAPSPPAMVHWGAERAGVRWGFQSGRRCPPHPPTPSARALPLPPKGQRGK